MYKGLLSSVPDIRALSRNSTTTCCLKFSGCNYFILNNIFSCNISTALFKILNLFYLSCSSPEKLCSHEQNKKKIFFYLLFTWDDF